MEKVIVTLRAQVPEEAWCTALRTEVAEELLALDLPGVSVHVRDGVVRDSLMTLTTLEPPVVALVSLWADTYYGQQVDAALARLRTLCGGPGSELAAYLVTESVPLPPPVQLRQRTDGFANVALLRRPATLDWDTWFTRWHRDHTPVAIATQSTFGYVQNTVVRPLTAQAPAIDAIVEELFPLAATADLHAFFGADDDADLADRMSRMVASTTAFGANENVDTVPTSRYVFRTPFDSGVAR